MILYFMIFTKRPHYALAFVPLLFMYLLTVIAGNSFIGLALLFFSCLCWCNFALALYIFEKKVNSTLFGVDLKDYVPVALVVMGLYALLLIGFWIPSMIGPISILEINFLMTVLFGYAFIAIFVGKGLILSSIAIKVARSDIQADKPSAQRLLEDIKKLIAQP